MSFYDLRTFFNSYRSLSVVINYLTKHQMYLNITSVLVLTW